MRSLRSFAAARATRPRSSSEPPGVIGRRICDKASVTEPAIEFTGLDPWHPGTNNPDLRANGRTVDLADSSSLLGIAARCPLGTWSQTFVLQFQHEDCSEFELAFADVVDLVLAQNPDEWVLYTDRVDAAAMEGSVAHQAVPLDQPQPDALWLREVCGAVGLRHDPLQGAQGVVTFS
jgi:hypothetical protein